MKLREPSCSSSSVPLSINTQQIPPTFSHQIHPRKSSSYRSSTSKFSINYSIGLICTMETPFLRPRYYSLRNRQVPVQRAPKVVSIPVQDAAGSERRRSDTDSALKIQKAYRGFLVRKNVNKIAAIKREVDEIETRISKKEMAELVRSDAKERLKVNETLMNLLLGLDSVKGVDPGVRDLRRAVIKKAIALQERVDASAEQTTETDYLSGNSQNSMEDEGVDDDHEVVKTESKEQKENNLVERMAEENEKMMGLMRELLHRNEKQTGLLSSLSQRVEQLERAFNHERLKKKTKRNSPCSREQFF